VSDLDFNDLIPGTKTKRPPPPRRSTIDFEDLVPQDQRIAYPKIDPAILEVARETMAKPRSEGDKFKAILKPPKSRPEPGRPIVRMPGDPDILAPSRMQTSPKSPEPVRRYPGMKGITSRPLQDDRIGFTESAKEEFTRPAKGAQYVPILGGAVAAAENLMYLSAAQRLTQGFDYTKPIRPETLMPGALGSIPARYATRQADEKLIADMILRLEKQQRRGYTTGGKVAKGLLQLPTWMAEFALTGGLAKIGDTAAKKAGTRLLQRYAQTKAGQVALKAAGWTGAAVTRASLGLAPRVVEKATERQVGVQILGADQEGWATSFAKAWGDVTIEAASETAGEAITGVPLKLLGKTKLGGKFVNGLQRAWMKATGGTAGAFVRKMASKGGYSNIVGEIGEERLATVLRAITKVDHFGAGRNSTVADRLKAGLVQDAKNIGVEAIVLSVPMAGQVALGQAIQTYGPGARGPEQGPKPISELPTPPVRPGQVTTIEDVKRPEPQGVETPQEIAKQVKRHAVDILPRKEEILAEIDVAIAKAPKTPIVREGKPETIHFDINGGLDVINDQATLRKVRAKVSAVPKTTRIPREPKRFKLSGVPLKAGKPTKLGEVKTDLIHAAPGYVTNGRFLYRGETPAGARFTAEEEGQRFTRDKPIPKEMLEDQLRASTEPATFEHFAVQEPEAGQAISARPITALGSKEQAPWAVVKSGGEWYTYDQAMFETLRQKFPDAVLGVDRTNGKLIMYEDSGRTMPVATVMPISKDERRGVVAYDAPPVQMEATQQAPEPETAVAPKTPGETAKVQPKEVFTAEEENWLERFRQSSEKIQRAEKTPGRAMTPEEIKLFEEDFEAYSKSRGYTDADIQAFKDHMSLVTEGHAMGFTDVLLSSIERAVGQRLETERATENLDLERQFRQKPTTKAEEPSEFIPPEPAASKKMSFEDLVPRPANVTHIQNVVVDQFREWPKGMKRVGTDYWTEVMATAKQLATPYRYKALRKTLLGVFRHKKAPVPEVGGIELQDVTDALTATHELGHNIDWLMSNKKFPSSIKARFPNAVVGEMTLRNELKKVSQVLRPDMWERPKAYIKSHTELMADYISHYILDPEKTGELAPNVTKAFEANLANKPELFDTVSRLQESRYEGPEEPAVAEHIREQFPLPKKFKPLLLAVDMMDKDYVKAAEELGITAARHYKLLLARAELQARRIDKLVPNKDRQIDLVVIAENGSKNPWTGKTRQEILKEGLTANEGKAVNLFRAYQEQARQTVNKYLRGANIAEYIKFIEDYFIHAYQTPMTEKYKTAISKWAKRSPQAKKRVLPDLAKSVELGLKPRAKTLSDGLRLWAGINYRVMTNKAFLRILPDITNDDGVSILQKPQDYPNWPTVDYWPIRQNYAVPLKNRGVLLFQGRVAVDPRVKPFIDAMFGRRVFSTPVRVIEGLNATWKAFELTLLSAFHHQAEFFSAAGALGPRALPFVGGYYGKRAQAFGKKKLFGFLPARIGVLKAGKELEKVPEFMEDYIAAGGQTGYISTEGINLMERMLKRVEDYFKIITQTKPGVGQLAWAGYVPAKGARATYSWFQHLLWDNVQRAKLVSYYRIVSDGAQNSDLPIKDVKEIAVKYVNDNFGGQEWLNTMFRDPKTRQFWTQIMMSLDWTWSQIKTARWPLGIGEKNAARRAFMRKIGRHHWFWYTAAISAFTIAGSYALSGKGPWDNEKGHKLDIDWTKTWRSLPWKKDWKSRGDYSRRYIGLGKAGRELTRWVTSPLRAFGYKLSPVARSTFEQATGHNMGSDWAEPWAREDMELYQEVHARFKHLMENFKPFSLSGNNAFLAFPSRKGMTQWKAIKAFEELFKVKANVAAGGLTAKLTKASHILDGSREKLINDIVQACVLNNVDAEKSVRAALTNVRSKYYGRFWNAAKRQDVEQCNRYGEALLALGVTEEGFMQSMTERARQLSREAVKMGIETFLKKQTTEQAHIPASNKHARNTPKI
jgi:hypothetical protein